MTVQLLDIPELNVIGWANVNSSGEPYANLWEYVFGELDIDAKFDAIPTKVQSSGCYLGLFQNRTSVPKLWEHTAWNIDFFLCVEVEQLDCILEGLVHKKLPASTYAIFTANGFPQLAFQHTWNYIYIMNGCRIPVISSTLMESFTSNTRKSPVRMMKDSKPIYACRL